MLIELDRNTRNWNTNFNFVSYSPEYEAPLGFVTQNSIHSAEISHSYSYFPEDKEGIIQQLQINVGSEITFNYNNLKIL